MLDAAIRISYPYEKVKQIIRFWSAHCQKIACYEHDDDGAARIHCHLHVEGCRVTIKRLQQLAGESGVPITVPNPDSTKRACSMMSTRQAKYDFNIAGYAYLTKGKYNPSYIQGFTPEECEKWKNAWVPVEEHVKRTCWRVMWEAYLPYSPAPIKFDSEAWLKSPDLLPPQLKFEDVKSSVLKYVMKKYQGLIPPQAKAEGRFLIDTFCANNSVSMPSNHSYF